MILSDREIHNYLKNGRLVLVGPNMKFRFNPAKQVQPASIDLRLDNRIVRFDRIGKSFDIRDLSNISNFVDVEYVEEKKPISLLPNSIAFGQIYEQMAIPNDLCGRIEGRSRFARLGISIHCTGDFINPGFVGAMPLQIVNHNSFEVIIYPYISICQLMLFKLTEEPLVPYSERSSLPYNRYQGEKEAGTSIMHLDEAINDELKIKSIFDEKIQILIDNYLNNMNKDIEDMKLRGVEPNQYIIQIFKDIEELIVRDKYVAQQAGIQGAKSVKDAQINLQQNITCNKNSDNHQLIAELKKLRQEMRKRDDHADYDIEIGRVAEAENAAKLNDKKGVLEALKKVGKFTLTVSKEIGTELITKLLVESVRL